MVVDTFKYIHSSHFAQYLPRHFCSPHGHCGKASGWPCARHRWMVRGSSSGLIRFIHQVARTAHCTRNNRDLHTRNDHRGTTPLRTGGRGFDKYGRSTGDPGDRRPCGGNRVGSFIHRRRHCHKSTVSAIRPFYVRYSRDTPCRRPHRTGVPMVHTEVLSQRKVNRGLCHSPVRSPASCSNRSRASTARWRSRRAASVTCMVGEPTWA